MRADDAKAERAESARRLRTLALARAWLMRGAAVILFALALEQWIGLVGVQPGAMGRFDLMPAQFRAAGATLAVLYPVAAVGLWTLSRWGPVVWALVLLALGVMHLGFPQHFGPGIVSLAVHMTGLSGLAAIAILARRMERPTQRYGSLSERSGASK